MIYNEQHINNVANKVRETGVNRGAGIDELFQLDLGHQDKKIKHYKQTIPVNIHHFYMVEEIRDVDYYLNMINTIRTSEQHDTIFIYLNTVGGNLYTTMQIIAAMRQSQATIITVMEGQVCSAGTMIFLSGDKHVIGPNSTFMIHNYSGMVGGKGNEMTSQLKYTETFFAKLAVNMYGNFLTEDEINSVLEGKDFWMDSDEVASRLGDKVIPQQPRDMLIDIDELIEQPSVPAATPVPKKSPKKSVAKKSSK